jgi:hypothetical protein
MKLMIIANELFGRYFASFKVSQVSLASHVIAIFKKRPLNKQTDPKIPQM